MAEKLGLLENEVGCQRKAVFTRRRTQMAALNALIDRTNLDGQPLSRAIRGATFELSDFQTALAGGLSSTSDIPHLEESPWRPTSLLSVFADRKYEPYLVRQHAEIKRQAELEHRRIPDAIDYQKLTHLRTEARQALIKFRPRTFGQAGRLEGITPADLTLLSVLVHR